MSDPSKMWCQPTLWDLGDSIFSAELADGTTPCNLPAGQQTDQSSPVAARVSHTRQPASTRGTPTNGTSGRKCTGSSASADQKSSSESKSPQPPSSGDLLNLMKVCRKCGIEKPYSEFSVNSKGNRPSACRECMNRVERAGKRHRSEKVAAGFKKWRAENRGRALTTVARHRAKVRGLQFDLDPENIQQRVDAGACELTGIPFDLTKPRAWNAPSLDRIDSTGGYTTDNVRVVLYSLNVMANTWGPQRILEIASAIMEQRRKASNDLSDRLGAKLQESLSQSGSMEYEQTWSRRVTPSGHVYWAHTASARRKSDTGCFGWPAPKAQEDGRTLEQYEAGRIKGYETRKGKTSGGPASKQGGLAIAAQLTGWATATARDALGLGSPARTERLAELGHMPSILCEQAMLAGWPAPTALSFADSHQPGNNRSMNRTVELAGWSSPRTPNGGRTTGTIRENGKPRSNLETEILGTTSASSPVSTARPGGFQLNGAMSRWLMGFPQNGATQGWDTCSPNWSSWVIAQRALAGYCARPSGTESDGCAGMGMR